MIELTSDQRSNIQKYMPSFISFLSTPKAKEWKNERDSRSSYVRLKLSRENIDKLTETDFKIIFLNLYATQVWTNKEYAFNNVLSNGFENLRSQLKDLIYGDADIALRYDKFKSNVKHLGPATITEILTLLDADRYCLWNVKPRSVLPFLKIRGDVPKKAFDYNAFDGSIYKSCIEIMQAIRKELEGSVSNPDLWDTDFFIAHIFYNVGEFKFQPEEREPAKISRKDAEATIAIGEEDIEHTAAEFLLLKIGNLLGYDTYTADPSQEYKGEKLGDISTVSDVTQFIPPQSLGSARRIDVIWFRDDAPVYCFEVEHSTGVTSGLHRLYQIRQLPAHFFIIAPSSVSSRFSSEVEKAPYKQISSRYLFRSYSDLKSLYHTIVESKNIEKNFFGRGS